MSTSKYLLTSILVFCEILNSQISNYYMCWIWRIMTILVPCPTQSKRPKLIRQQWKEKSYQRSNLEILGRRYPMWNHQTQATIHEPRRARSLICPYCWWSLGRWLRRRWRRVWKWILKIRKFRWKFSNFSREDLTEIIIFYLGIILPWLNHLLPDNPFKCTLRTCKMIWWMMAT